MNTNTPDPNEPRPLDKGTPSSAAPRGRAIQPAVVIAAAAVLLLAVQWYDSHQQMKILQADLGRRLAAVDVESRSATEQARDTTREAQTRFEQLDARQQEMQKQQAALEGLYQDLARSRDDALLADLEQMLLSANQQIQFGGNLRAALITAQSVDARLARLDRPPLVALRSVLARDIERLKQAPRADTVAIAARLDELAANIDSLTLLIDARPSESPAARKNAPPPEANPWLRFAREFWQDVRELIRIEKIDNADVAPLTVGQAYFLRENLRLRLLGARVALLAHHEKSYASDLKAAGDWLARYFDVRREAVAAAVTALRQLHDNAANLQPPDVTASLDAVRNLRAAAERR